MNQNSQTRGVERYSSPTRTKSGKKVTAEGRLEPAGKVGRGHGSGCPEVPRVRSRQRWKGVGSETAAGGVSIWGTCQRSSGQVPALPSRSVSCCGVTSARKPGFWGETELQRRNPGAGRCLVTWFRTFPSPAPCPWQPLTRQSPPICLCWTFV